MSFPVQLVINNYSTPNFFPRLHEAYTDIKSVDLFPNRLLNSKTSVIEIDKNSNHAFIPTQRSWQNSVTKRNVFGSLDWDNGREWQTNTKASDRLKDDGVVLLVGLFNLFAVVVYAGQKLLSGNLSKNDDRVISWQIQKVLDELVLKVHSSDTATNLLSRAFKSSVKSVNGRDMAQNSFINQFQQIITDKNPANLKKILRKVSKNLMREMLKILPHMNGPRIDPGVYTPLASMYRKMTKTNREGRFLRSSFLESATNVAGTLAQMDMGQIQNMLLTINQLGKLDLHYDLTSLIKMVGKKLYNYQANKSVRRRSKRTITQPYKQLLQELHQLGRRQRNNSKYSHYTKSSLEYRARKMGELAKQLQKAAQEAPLKLTKFISKKKGLVKQMGATSNATQSKNKNQKPKSKKNKRSDQNVREESDILMKKIGFVETVTEEDLSASGWADGWFALLTKASPVALDISTLYSRAREQPQCLRSFLCESNRHWRNKPIFQAALSPLLSIAASWAMEKRSPHTLGDSLIAIRAGWMAKKCHVLYPQCSTKAAPHYLAEEVQDFFSSKKKHSTRKTSHFLSKRRDIFEENSSEVEIDGSHQKKVADPFPKTKINPTHSSTSSVTPIVPTSNNDVSSSSNSYEFSMSTSPNQYDRHDDVSMSPLSNFDDSPMSPSLIQHNRHGDLSMSSSSIPYDRNDDVLMSHSSNSYDVSMSPSSIPYDRYDRPPLHHRDVVPSGSVSGMALQDRPLPTPDEPIPIDRMDQVQEEEMNYSEGSPNYVMKKTQTSEDSNIHFAYKNQHVAERKTKKIKAITGHLQSKQKERGPFPRVWRDKMNQSFLHRSGFSNPKKPQEQAPIMLDNETVFHQANTINRRHYVVAEDRRNTDLEGPVKPLKYKYGLRRGLPARNVNGHGPLLERKSDKSTKAYEQKSGKKIALPNLKSSFKVDPVKPDYQRNHNHAKYNHKLSFGHKNANSRTSAKFDLNDAITDPFLNNMLYQYIRDRRISTVS